MSNIIRFKEPTDLHEVTKYNTGVEPRYGKKGSTARGDAWCSCTKCVGSLLLFPNSDKVVGFFKPKCDCGNYINWSNAKDFL